uniref:Secreted protein n=1 Tax=Panagrellus redivivus TaxID=6233 RepID=A0A7E4V0D2_PANRE
MQPRTLYTLLLMLAILGSALGQPLKRHMRESANIRALIAKGIRRLKVAAYENLLDYDTQLLIGEKLIGDLFPDQEIYKKHHNDPLWALCELLYGYVKLMPVEKLKNMHVKFLNLKRVVDEENGWVVPL